MQNFDLNRRQMLLGHRRFIGRTSARRCNAHNTLQVGDPKLRLNRRDRCSGWYAAELGKVAVSLGGEIDSAIFWLFCGCHTAAPRRSCRPIAQ